MFFSSIPEALSFQKKCPFCKSPLNIRCKKHVGKYASSTLPEIKNKKIHFSPAFGDIYLHLKNPIIEGNFSPSLIGEIFFDLRQDCMSCWQYYQIINFGIKLPETILTKCFINVIGLKRIINNVEYSIKSFKSLDQTIFSKIIFENPLSSSEEAFEWNEQTIRLPEEIIFPFTEIDLKNPDKTIIRLDDLSFYT